MQFFRLKNALDKPDGNTARIVPPRPPSAAADPNGEIPCLQRPKKGIKILSTAVLADTERTLWF